MSPAPKIYLAGPDVFWPDAHEIGLRKKMLCEQHGFIGLYPLDHDFSRLPGEKLDDKIFSGNLALMRAADAGIFNLSPFRGVNADPGTAFELGFFSALGKPVFAYSAHPQNYFDRVSAAFGLRAGAGGELRDAEGLTIENFDNADNLMLDGALKMSGRRVFRAQGGDDDAELSGFSACLRQARDHFHL